MSREAKVFGHWSSVGKNKTFDFKMNAVIKLVIAAVRETKLKIISEAAQKKLEDSMFTCKIYYNVGRHIIRKGGFCFHRWIEVRKYKIIIKQKRGWIKCQKST